MNSTYIKLIRQYIDHEYDSSLRFSVINQKNNALLHESLYEFYLSGIIIINYKNNNYLIQYLSSPDYDGMMSINIIDKTYMVKL